MALTPNIGLHVYSDAELEQAFSTVRQWRLSFQGNNDSGSESDLQIIDAAIGELMVKKTISVVSSLPTPSQTEYDKHLLYSYNNKLYFMIFSQDVYSIIQVGKEGKVYTDSVVATTDWVSDNTYDSYPYKAEITTAGVTANDVMLVVFNVVEAMSGNYAPVCLSSANTVTIYAKEVPASSITIPTIKEVI